MAKLTHFTGRRLQGHGGRSPMVALTFGVVALTPDLVALTVHLRPVQS
jgi:predicted transcriptional regulator